ncbi:MAG: ABC transporter ATP-binding protein [Anaerolineae bacterium]|nr:ABC transporter ATP-binding protein [Anaerolineae bacterium]
MTQSSTDYLIEVRDLQTFFYVVEGEARAVDGASFTIERGHVLGVVGESGCGKSVTARSILNMVRPPGKIVHGEIVYHRTPEETVCITDLPPMGDEMRAIRGGEIAMIFQEPRASLSPVHSIGDQVSENILLHQKVSREEAEQRALEMLRQVGLPKPEQIMRSYPHQLSGGMCQRAMIAMALSCHPRLLIADEPTTALDVTTEAQILELMQALRQDYGMSIMFITHNLGVIAEMADEVAVMYLGRVVEQGTVVEIFDDPKHPYTRALLESLPRIEQEKEWLATIPGIVPDPYRVHEGCPFFARCRERMPGVCDTTVPVMIDVGGGHEVRCLLYGGLEEPASTPTVRTSAGER